MFHYMLNVGLFCTSSQSAPLPCITVAQQLGRWIGTHRSSLIYGGVDCGLMYETAYNVKHYGGQITGIITSALEAGGIASSLPDILIRTTSLSQRKQTMMELADIFVVLPGGIGTLDETLSVLAAAHLQEHKKPLILLNLDGFFNPILSLFEQFYVTGYASEKYREYYINVTEWDDCIKILTENLNEKLHNKK